MERLKNKKIIITIVILILIFGIVLVVLGISNKKSNNTPKINTSEVENSNRSMDKITMTIKEGTLTKTSATVFIEDTNDSPYSYGEWYRIDKKENDDWKELDTINSVPEIALPMLEYGHIERNIDWTETYGPLSKGEYRIVKRPVGVDNEIYVEFTIDN